MAAITISGGRPSEPMKAVERSVSDVVPTKNEKVTAPKISP